MEAGTGLIVNFFAGNAVGSQNRVSLEEGALPGKLFSGNTPEKEVNGV